MFKKIILTLLLVSTGQAQAALALAGKITRRLASVGALGVGSFVAFVELKNSIHDSLDEHRRGFLVPLLPFAHYTDLNWRHFLSSKIHDDEKALIAKEYFYNLASRKNDISGLRPLDLNELDCTLGYIPEKERLEKFIQWFEADRKNRNRDKERLMGIVAFRKEHEKNFSCSMDWFANTFAENMASTASCFPHSHAYQIINTYINDPQERKEALSFFFKSNLICSINRIANDDENASEDVSNALSKRLKEGIIKPMYGHFSSDFSSQKEMVQEVFGPHKDHLRIPYETFIQD